MKERFIEILPFPKIPTPEILYVGTDPTSGEDILGFNTPRCQEDVVFEN